MSLFFNANPAIPPTFALNFEKKMKITTRHYGVPADLQPYVDSFWYAEAEGPQSEISSWQYCLATGLIEMIIHVTPTFTHKGILAGRSVEFPETFIGGIHVEPVLFKMRGGTGMFGISLATRSTSERGISITRPTSRIAARAPSVPKVII